MAFAFCTANALLELKLDGDISFATGATKSLFGLDGSKIIGKNLHLSRCRKVRL